MNPRAGKGTGSLSSFTYRASRAPDSSSACRRSDPLQACPIRQPELRSGQGCAPRARRAGPELGNRGCLACEEAKTRRLPRVKAVAEGADALGVAGLGGSLAPVADVAAEVRVQSVL